MVEQIEGDKVPFRTVTSTLEESQSLTGREDLLAQKSLPLATLQSLAPPALLNRRGIVTPSALTGFGALMF